MSNPIESKIELQAKRRKYRLVHVTVNRLATNDTEAAK